VVLLPRRRHLKTAGATSKGDPIPGLEPTTAAPHLLPPLSLPFSESLRFLVKKEGWRRDYGERALDADTERRPKGNARPTGELRKFAC
jgi:hypothetical protein